MSAMYNYLIMAARTIAILSLAAILLTACTGGEDEPYTDTDAVYPDITVMAPLSGVGDNGYNDEALAGIFDGMGDSGLELSILRPRSLAQAEALAEEWEIGQTGKRRLLILADNEYDGIARNMELPGNLSVLLFEHDGEAMPGNVASFRISRYGVSYLSGCLAQGSGKVCIVGAREDNPVIKEASEAFTAGYRAKNPAGEIVTQYLADDASGFAMPDSLYRLAAKHHDDFFFPLAKGSNAGLFKYSRETPFVLLLIAGMDVDCSLMSKRVPFSVVVDVRSVTKDYVSRWISGEDISGHRDFGMADGTAQVRLHPLFYEINDVWESYYSNPAYWRNIYDSHYQEALEKENEYETSE